MATSNPAFSQDMFAGYGQVYGVPRSTVTTVQGTMGKCFLLLGIMTGCALFAFQSMATGSLAPGVLPVAGIAGFVLALVTIFKPTLAPWTSPVYAAMEGVFLGAVSQVVEMRFGKAYPGIALQAVMLTGGTLLMMLFVYGNGIIRVTDRLKSGVIMATGALCLFYVATMLLRLFGVTMPMVYSSSPIGIAFSLFVVGLAAFNLLLDFDFIEEAAARQAPKYMEWYGAFGLMVTLVWLYLEMLRLLQKVASNRD
ncbi:Bax inhibitor-1/YccA family protein [Aquisphaera insulae]|uniref:Bax inhibitor-1/YccA family protein n=1 Tax=Aquisphaera insulae TaxID=2712864 RepID=UPI00196A67F1|nr:Bax inhibitor-1/YccA family protein [Aquisphaera insulae]